MTCVKATMLVVASLSLSSGSLVVPPPAYINSAPLAVPPFVNRVDLVTRALKTPLVPAPVPFGPAAPAPAPFLPGPAPAPYLPGPAPDFSGRFLPGPVVPGSPFLPPRVFPGPFLPPFLPPRVYPSYPSQFLPSPFLPPSFGAPFASPFGNPFTIPGAYPPFYYRR